jgi:hypothetical protein
LYLIGSGESNENNRTGWSHNLFPFDQERMILDFSPIIAELCIELWLLEERLQKEKPDKMRRKRRRIKKMDSKGKDIP